MNFRILQGIKNSLSLTEDERRFVTNISEEYKEWELRLSNEEKRLIRKYTLNSHDDKKPNRFFERLNRAMRNKYNGPDKNKLLYYGDVISKAICKHPIKQQIVCYRGVDDNLVGNERCKRCIHWRN